MVLGRGRAQFRAVRLGGHKVRKARGNVSDVDDAAGVFLYRDSIAPLLDMRRKFGAVLCVLSTMLRWGVSLARSIELTSQWDKVFAIGRCCSGFGYWWFLGWFCTSPASL